MKQGLLFFSFFILSSYLSFGQSENNYALFDKGKSAFDKKEYKTAIKLFEDCLSALEQSTTIDSFLFGKIHFEIGSAKKELSDNKQALIHTKIAYDILTGIDITYLDNGRLIHQMAYTHFYNSKYKESQPFFKKGIRLYQNKGALDTLSFCYQFFRINILSSCRL